MNGKHHRNRQTHLNPIRVTQQQNKLVDLSSDMNGFYCFNLFIPKESLQKLGKDIQKFMLSRCSQSPKVFKSEYKIMKSLETFIHGIRFQITFLLDKLDISI